MPRHRRIVVPSYPHHIVQRGHNRRDVFITDSDRHAYQATLSEFREVLGIRIYSYCLMSNHVHLIVDPGSDPTSLGRLMKRLAGRCTRRINCREQRTGTAWEGRFRCSPIETDRYLMACTRYVDLNPVRAGLVARPEDYPWSSYRARIGLVHCQWLDPDPCYLALADLPEVRQRRYRAFVEEVVHDEELGFIRRAVGRNQLTGSEAFVAEIEQRTGKRIDARDPGRPRVEK